MTPVAIVGAGTIGVGWAVVFAAAGHPVTLFDVDPVRLGAVPGEIAERASELASLGLLGGGADPGAAASLCARVRVATDLAGAVAGAGYVQECVAESVPVKREIFAELDRLAPARAVLASSTSMIPCSRIAAHLPGRSRCLVVHPGNPPYLLPVAEVAPAPFTAESTVDAAWRLLAAAGMVPVRVAVEQEGFIFNRLQGALLREAYRLVRDGVATPEEIDRVVTAGLGRRWAVLGPFATAELNTRGGLRRHAEVMGPAYERMGAERGQRDPWPPDLVERVAQAVARQLPPAAWADHVRRRDRAMMRLAQARRAEPDLFTSLSGDV